MSIITTLIQKLFAVILSATMLFGANVNCVGNDNVDKTKWNTNYKYVFVHGLSGWGSYDAVNNLMPYWGMFGGDLMKYLKKQGFDCYAASVAPNGSAWDRACELYAQLTGNVVDYGKEHSERCGHERFGTDFSGKALIKEFDEENKINLLGHSFGGATVRLFASIMKDGSDKEKAVTESTDLSPFFEGGKGDWIYSMVTLAAPHNGTTAYDVKENDLKQYIDKSNPVSMVKTIFEVLFANLVSMASDSGKDKRDISDYADYDMKIDNAFALNETISNNNNTYYFSIPCNASVEDKNGNYLPVDKEMEILFRTSSKAMGVYTTVTPNGVVIDDSWKMNDGLVNTISATAPFNAPSVQYDESNVQKGVWNVMPVYEGDHMSLQGGLFKTNDVKGLYVDLLSMINELG